MKQPITKRLASDALAPLIQFANAHPGTFERIAQRLATETGTVQYRQNVEGWLHENPKLRVEPRLGMGLLLLSLWERGVIQALNNGTPKKSK